MDNNPLQQSQANNPTPTPQQPSTTPPNPFLTNQPNDFLNDITPPTVNAADTSTATPNNNPFSTSTYDAPSLTANDFDNSPRPSSANSFTSPTPQPKKKSNASSILMLLMFFVTLCGVGFGVYGFFFQPPQEKIIYKTSEPEKSETASSPDYLYFGEWGLKIKKPTTLSHISFSFNSTDLDSQKSLKITAIGADDTISTLPAFANITTNPNGLVTILRRKQGECIANKDASIECPTPIYKDDTYEYILEVPDTTPSTDDPNDQLMNKATVLLQTWLKDSANFSKF